MTGRELGLRRSLRVNIFGLIFGFDLVLDWRGQMKKFMRRCVRLYLEILYQYNGDERF